MIAHALFFYFFSIIAIVSAIFVIVSRNTVHAVFFLILDFISIACLFIMIGAEFLGMMMLIVYVGAVAVLFLFVVMLMNVTEQKLSWFRGTKKTGHIPVGLIIGTNMFANVFTVIIPNQMNIINSSKKDQKFDMSLSLAAKQRSIHNNYSTFLVLFIILADL